MEILILAQKTAHLKTELPSVISKLTTYLVQPASEIDDNFSGSVVVDDLKLSNIT